jgi:hypothetical protein
MNQIFKGNISIQSYIEDKSKEILNASIKDYLRNNIFNVTPEDWHDKVLDFTKNWSVSIDFKNPSLFQIEDKEDYTYHNLYTIRKFSFPIIGNANLLQYFGNGVEQVENFWKKHVSIDEEAQLIFLEISILSSSNQEQLKELIQSQMNTFKHYLNLQLVAIKNTIAKAIFDLNSSHITIDQYLKKELDILNYIKKI